MSTEGPDGGDREAAEAGPMAGGTITASFTIRVEGVTRGFRVEVPAGEVTLPELWPALGEFGRQWVDGAVAEATRDGARVSCRAGCGACCRQLVPVSGVERVVLRAWMAGQTEARQEAWRRRLAEAVARVTASGLLDRLDPGALADAADVRRLGLEYFGLGVPCPFLEDESCAAYPARPMKCREFLVTSPAEHCARPSPLTVRMVPVPRSFLPVLLRMAAEATGRPPRWTPLILLGEPEVEAEDAALLAVQRPGPVWFEEFVGRLVR